MDKYGIISPLSPSPDWDVVRRTISILNEASVDVLADRYLKVWAANGRIKQQLFLHQPLSVDNLRKCSWSFDLT
jgi:hypothetical protein